MRISKSKISILFLLIILLSSSVSATMNVAVITDPNGTDPNGCAAGSQSYASNMFQSTFIFSQEHQMALLSGGEGTSDVRVAAIINALTVLQNNGTPTEIVSVASNYDGIRLMAVNPTQGIAVGGDFDVYVVTVDENDTINIQAASGGVASVPAGTRGGIIHLRNSEGNPKSGTADTVRLEAAIKMGTMIRDGYSATEIVAQIFGEVAEDSGENHGGGAINLISGITTGDMFTPEELNDTGYEMNEPYSKVSDSGWSVGYPEAENYEVSPIDGSELEIVYAYEALGSAITVSDDSPSVSTYGSDEKGISDATTGVVESAVEKNGYDPVSIAQAINNAIDAGSIIGVEYVDASDINVKENTKAVGVYYTPTPNDKTSPSWDIPIDPSILDLLGNLQTVVGILLILLAVLRTTLMKNLFKNRR